MNVHSKSDPSSHSTPRPGQGNPGQDRPDHGDRGKDRPDQDRPGREEERSPDEPSQGHPRKPAPGRGA